MDTPECEKVRDFCNSLSKLHEVFSSFSARDTHGAILETMNNIKEEVLELMEAEMKNTTAVRNAIEKRLSQLIEV
jgi:hypothetical protein